MAFEALKNKAVGRARRAQERESNPYSGMPTAPGYGSSFLEYDPSAFGSQEYMQGMLDPIQLDQRGLSQYREEALRKGPSEWANLRNQEQRLGELDNIEGINRGVAGQQAAQRSQLAMRGGLSSGARERLGTSGAANMISMRQQARRSGQGERMNIASTDERNRIAQLGKLPGMEIAALQPAMDKAKFLGIARESDAANRMKQTDNRSRDLTGRNEYNQNRYGQQMSAWAANKQAQATADSGK